MKLFSKQKKDKAGFTMIELLIAIVLLSTVIVTMTQIFQVSISSQRRVVAAQNVQESLRYFFEVVSKEMRMAQASVDGECGNTSGVDKIYTLANGDTELYFKNYNGQCVIYSLEADSGVNRFRIDRDLDYGYITPVAVTINSIKFYAKDDMASNQQSTITLDMVVESDNKDLFKSVLNVQTTISSRYYY